MKKEMFTRVPGMENIELKQWYEEFEWYYPDCELATKEWFVKSVKPSWNIMDCGANIGYYSILFSRLAPNGNIWAFEPTKTVTMLQANLLFHQVQNVEVYQVALGAKNGLHKDGLYRIWGDEPEYGEYSFTTIDRFVKEKKIDRIDCIKIDVDSFDFEVLQGTQETFMHLDPFIVVELNHALSRRNQSNAEALLWMRTNGYTETLCIDFENYVFKRNFGFDGGNAIKIHFY